MQTLRSVCSGQDALFAKGIGAIEPGLHGHARYLTQQGLAQTMADLSGKGRNTGTCFGASFSTKNG
jgi:hypothetical protein